MELRVYAKILWRYIWLIALIVGIVLIYSGYQYYKLRQTSGALSGYSSNISMQIGLSSTAQGNTNPADDVTVSESLADTLSTGPILSSKEFCSDISSQIALDMGQIQQQYPGGSLGDWTNPGAIAGALSATRAHSVVTISVNWSTAAGSWAIANAIGEIGTSRMGKYLDYIVTTNYNRSATNGNAVQPEVSARVISAASTPASVSGVSSSKILQLALLIIIALALAIALAFLLSYLDDRIWTREDLDNLFHLPVYGEIPHAPTPGHATKPSKISA